jgi:hypothetical protein
MTREQAKQLSADFSKALAQEPDAEIRANGMPIVKLFAELAKEMPEAERDYVSKRLPLNLRMFEKVKARVNGLEQHQTELSTSDPLI